MFCANSLTQSSEQGSDDEHAAVVVNAEEVKGKLPQSITDLLLVRQEKRFHMP
jgi:hypothetical protein